MITVTESAQHKILELFEEEGNPDLKLRTFVQGGGCSGMQYGFTFDELQNEDDFEIECGPIKLLVDTISMQYLTEATIDFVEDTMGASFTIKNPNAQTTCGCGSSFSPY
jgi:iron-sulfur cluster insertion protein